MVIHDETVNRTTNGKGNVTQMSLDQVRALDAGRWFHPCYAGLKVPTLEEVFRLVKERRRTAAPIALNMKKLSPGIEEKIVKLVERYGLLECVFAFDMPAESARRFKKANPKIRTCGSAGTPEQMKALIDDPLFDDVWIRFIPAEEDVKRAHDRGKRIWLWDWALPAGPKLWDLCNQARKVGLDGICTDHPLEVREMWMGKGRPR